MCRPLLKSLLFFWRRLLAYVPGCEMEILDYSLGRETAASQERQESSAIPLTRGVVKITAGRAVLHIGGSDGKSWPCF